jgi:hypothetical protein
MLPRLKPEISSGVLTSIPITSSLPGSEVRSALDNRAAPARDDGSESGRTLLPHSSRPARTRTRTGEVGARRAAFTPQAFARSLRQDSNPHLGRTKGACLPLTLRRQGGDGGSRTRSSSVQARRSATRELHPHGMRTDGVEPPRHEAPGLQPGELTIAQRPR